MIKNANIISIGQAAAYIQEMPTKITETAYELGIEPAMRINGIAHFYEDDLQQIADTIRKANQ